jgi:hypothetical protein
MAVRVPLQFVKATMRLARPVVDAEGKLVAGGGTHLREGVVRALRKMAVQSVLVVEGDDVGTWETVKPLEQELRDLEARFGAGRVDGPLGELRAALARHLAARAARLAEDPGMRGDGELPDAGR